ncbi:cyclic nucleotide-binding domain-containing protein [Streptococcus uberis]|uniref:cyclic nucleotide-binding domain-containing protein n=1 Tax=Streptococcus uberis TaxID=1349 RepID=UPI003D6C5B47
MKTISDTNLLHKLLKKHRLSHFFPSTVQKDLHLLLFQKNEAICLQDQDLDFIGYALEGAVKIVRRLPNGKEHVLETHARPSLIGDIELLTNQKAVTSVIALKSTYFIYLPLRDKKKLLKDPDFLYQIGQVLANNFYQQNVKSTQNMGYTVKERLARHILDQENNGVFGLELSLLADSFGTSYRHLHRVIQQLISQNIIERQAFKSYCITDFKSLEALALKEE